MGVSRFRISRQLQVVLSLSHLNAYDPESGAGFYVFTCIPNVYLSDRSDLI